MSDQLGPAARALLDAAREGMTPDPAAIARVRAKVGASVATGGLAGIVSSKLAALAVVATIAGGVVYATRAEPSGDPIALALAPALEREAPRVTNPGAAILDVAPPSAVIEMPPDRVAVRRAPRIELGREVALVDTAMAALRRGDARGALAAVRTHALETAGAGQLAEDAAAIELEALCLLGDAAVPARLTAFDTRWPDSAQRVRITRACGPDAAGPTRP